MQDKVTLRGVSLPALLFSSAGIIPPTLHSRSSHVALTRGADRRRLGDFKKVKFFQKLESIGQQCLMSQFDRGTWAIVKMCGQDTTMGWPKPKTAFSKIKTAIKDRKLLLDAELTCGNLQEESVEHSLG
jgi:hypothetical protein